MKFLIFNVCSIPIYYVGFPGYVAEIISRFSQNKVSFNRWSVVLKKPSTHTPTKKPKKL